MCSSTARDVFRKATTLVLVLVFLFMNSGYAQAMKPAEDNRSSLGPYYVSQLIEKNGRHADELSQGVESNGGRTAKDRAGDLKRDWTGRYTPAHAEKMVAKALKAGDGITLDQAEREYRRQIEQWDADYDVKMAVQETLRARIEDEKRRRERARGSTTGAPEDRNVTKDEGKPSTDAEKELRRQIEDWGRNHDVTKAVEEALKARQEAAERDEKKTRGSTTGDSTSGIAEKPALREEAAQAAIAHVEQAMQDVVTHMALRSEGPMSMHNTVVIMKKDLPEFAMHGKASMVQERLRHRYQLMVQDLRKSIPGENSVIEVQTQAELKDVMNGLIGEEPDKGMKVIVLDDNTLTQGLNPSEIRGKAGEHYCIISADAASDLDETTIQFLNLHAMTLMGLGVLHHDTQLFEMAYALFTGQEPPQNLIDDLKHRALWLIQALPRIVKFTDELRDQHLMDRLFEVAA